MVKKIVIVEDEIFMREELQYILEKAGYDVLCVNEFSNATDEIIASSPDLLLLDLNLPNISGFEICKQIRSLVDCPILFLTAKTQETDIVRGLGLGGDDYITKPFGANELRARVNAHLRRDAREKKYSVNISGVTFLLNAKEAQYNSEKLLLTKSEYEICEYLALHRGQVFSKEQIYEAVFGFDGESDDAVIATHIKNIRNKLLAKNLSPIETVWGVGYKWV